MTVGGKATNGDIVTVVTHNPLLPGGQESVSYTVGASDTLVDVSAGLAANISANSDLQDLEVSAKNGEAADLAFSQSFSGNGTLPSGASLANISATDAVPTTKTNTNSLNVTASGSSTLTWDANGNMTSDGTNTYKWDAENRLIEIDYPGANNYSQFSYDGLSRNTKIVETTGGSVTSTKQFVWCGERRYEERDGGASLTRKFFNCGQTITGTNYFYAKPHLGSISEMTDSSGIVQVQYSYEPYGMVTQIQGVLEADFQYAGYYHHSRSGFALPLFRAYDSKTARWLSREPLENQLEMYSYCNNNPISFPDYTGERPVDFPKNSDIQTTAPSDYVAVGGHGDESGNFSFSGSPGGLGLLPMQRHFAKCFAWQV